MQIRSQPWWCTPEISALKTEAGGLPRVQSQPGLRIETLSQKTKNAKTEQPTNKIESGEVFFFSWSVFDGVTSRMHHQPRALNNRSSSMGGYSRGRSLGPSSQELMEGHRPSVPPTSLFLSAHLFPCPHSLFQEHQLCQIGVYPQDFI